MAILFDSYGNEINNLCQLGGETTVDNRVNMQTINTLNGQVVMDCIFTENVVVDIRGTFSATLILEATVNGTDYFQIHVINVLTEIGVGGITSVGTYIGVLPSSCKSVRIRCSAYTSGIINVFMRGNAGLNILYSKPIPTTQAVTLLTTANTAGTLTIPAAGVGLYHYITRVEIVRINPTTTAVAAAATVLAITTTNITGSPQWSSANALAAGAQVTDVLVEMAGNPLKSTASNTATTFVMPAGGAGVQYRANVFYYVGS